MYFKYLPNLVYTTSDNKNILVKDIFNRVGFRDGKVSSLNMDAYYLDDGETPEDLSNRVYGTPNYHWTILLVNNITNPYEEWPKSQQALVEYAERKYGANNLTALHHYIITGTDLVVDYDAAKLTDGTYSEVTNMDYEVELNESKRHIFLVKNRFIGDFVKVFRRLVR